MAYPLINRQKFNIFSSKFFLYSVNDHPIEKDFELRDRDIYCRSFVNFVFDLFSSFLTSFQIIIQFFVEIFGRRCWFSFCFSATASTTAASPTSRRPSSGFLYSTSGRSSTFTHWAFWYASNSISHSNWSNFRGSHLDIHRSSIQRYVVVLFHGFNSVSFTIKYYISRSLTTSRSVIMNCG